MGKSSFTETDIKRLLRAVRAAGEIPDKVWVQRSDGKTTLEIKIRTGADVESTQPDQSDTWADVA